MGTPEENRKEEEMIIERVRQAFERRQTVFLKVRHQFYSLGNGQPTPASLDELDQVNAEYKAAQAEMDRVTDEIRTGKRP